MSKNDLIKGLRKSLFIKDSIYIEDYLVEKKSFLQFKALKFKENGHIHVCYDVYLPNEGLVKKDVELRGSTIKKLLNLNLAEQHSK